MTPRRPLRAAQLLLAPLLLIIAVGLSACASSASGRHADQTRPPAPAHQVRTTPTRTVVHTFTAYRADGTPVVASARTENGYCWNSSLAASGRTAFRCFSDAAHGSQIFDPCYAPPTPDPTRVLCVNDPWSSGTTLRLTSALPTPVANEAARPWAVQLATGTRCVASTGTVPNVGGVNLSYHCSDGTAAAFASSTATPMTAVYARPDASSLSRTTVAAIWRT